MIKHIMGRLVCLHLHLNTCHAADDFTKNLHRNFPKTISSTLKVKSLRETVINISHTWVLTLTCSSYQRTSRLLLMLLVFHLAAANVNCRAKRPESSMECKEFNLGFMGTPGDHGVFTEKVVLAHTAHNTRFVKKKKRKNILIVFYFEKNKPILLRLWWNVGFSPSVYTFKHRTMFTCAVH